MNTNRRNQFKTFLAIIGCGFILACLVWTAEIKSNNGMMDNPYTNIAWADDVRNPDNEEFVVEVAFNLGIEDWHMVTQEQFNERYNIK
jgi:hypothetical protein